MRFLIVGLVGLLATAAAAAELPADDAYYACLVGHGAVALVHRSSADAAFDAALAVCPKEAAEAAKLPGGDIGNAAHGVEDAAAAAINRLADNVAASPLTFVPSPGAVTLVPRL